MATFLFWNLCERPLAPVLRRLTARHGIDVLMLAECAIPEETMLNALNAEGQGPFHRVPPVASQRLDLYSRFDRSCFGHDAILDVRGLNALADSRTVQRKDPRRFGRLQVEEFRLFYNPMWSHFRDAVQPAGTYYYDKSNPEVDPLWNIFDQVLLRPSLLDRFRNKNLKILTTDGQVSFTWPDGRPNGDVFSDHLPLWFRLELRRRKPHAIN